MCGSIFVICIIASDSTHVPVGKLMLTNVIQIFVALYVHFQSPSHGQIKLFLRMTLFVPLHGCVTNIDCHSLGSLIIAPVPVILAWQCHRNCHPSLSAVRAWSRV